VICLFVFFEQRPAFFGQPFIDYIHIDGEPAGAAEAQNTVRIARDVQAIFGRRRRQPRRPPLAKISPGLPINYGVKAC
jgi:hypothetical protein